jgi:hypothetical protein
MTRPSFPFCNDPRRRQAEPVARTVCAERWLALEGAQYRNRPNLRGAANA